MTLKGNIYTKVVKRCKIQAHNIHIHIWWQRRFWSHALNTHFDNNRQLLTTFEIANYHFMILTNSSKFILMSNLDNQILQHSKSLKIKVSTSSTPSAVTSTSWNATYDSPRSIFPSRCPTIQELCQKLVSLMSSARKQNLQWNSMFV